MPALIATGDYTIRRPMHHYDMSNNLALSDMKRHATKHGGVALIS
jgi:hypothetical protein